MKTIHVLISAWVAVAVIGLGTAAPAFVSANKRITPTTETPRAAPRAIMRPGCQAR